MVPSRLRLVGSQDILGQSLIHRQGEVRRDLQRENLALQMAPLQILHRDWECDIGNELLELRLRTEVRKHRACYKCCLQKAARQLICGFS